MKNFFQIYRDHFWRFLLLNFLSFLLMLPLLLVVYFCANAAFGIVETEAVTDILPGLGFYMSIFSAQTRAGEIAVYLSVAFSALLYGPLKQVIFGIQCRIYSGNYYFLHDVFCDLRRKLIKAEVFGLIDLLILAQLLANLSGLKLPTDSEIINNLIRGGSLIVLLAWLQIRRYMFLMTAAGEFGFLATIKNSWILSVSDLGCNSKCALFCAITWSVTFLILPLVTVFVLPIFSYSTSSFISTCCLYPTIKKRLFNENDQN